MASAAPKGTHHRQSYSISHEAIAPMLANATDGEGDEPHVPLLDIEKRRVDSIVEVEDSPSYAEDELYNADMHVKKRTPPLVAAALITVFVCISGGLIIYNKYILHTLKFPYPITLTAWHLTFATICTQTMARTSTMLDSRKDLLMTPGLYCRTVLPISILFMLSLVCGNSVYLYLTVSFIQMLKAATPIAVLLASWAFRLKEVNYYSLLNIAVIALGVVIASLGEASFNLVGIVLQVGGIVFEALRLVLVQKLLTPNKSRKMDALVLLYYYAPCCAVMIATTAIVVESPRLTLEHVMHVGWPVFLTNAIVAFMLNVAMVYVIEKTSSLAVTLSGIVKTVVLILLSMLLFGDSISTMQAVGFSISLLALFVYQVDLSTLRTWMPREDKVVPVWLKGQLKGQE